MKMITFDIPNSVSSDFAGYDFLSKLNHDLQQKKFQKIAINFANNTWFEANLCAVLGAVLSEAGNDLNEISIFNLKEKQHSIFSRNHFLAAFGGEKIPDYNETTIKYRKNKLSDDKLIKEFLYNELINKPDFPQLSEEARKEIIRSIFEIYSNAIIHGGSLEVFSCGQYYPRKSPPRIDFTIVDMGHTIKRNVNEFLHADMSGAEAIQWALKERNTTKPKESNIPGGLGLKLIYEFVQMNNGKIQIVSNDGYWQLNKNKEISNNLNYPFPGTIVNLEFNLDDKSFYYLSREKENDIIF